jgi:hypothetical protein
MREELKTTSAVALVGGAVGAGLAVGIGLRIFATVGLAGLVAGAAIGVASGLRARKQLARSSRLHELS